MAEARNLAIVNNTTWLQWQRDTVAAFELSLDSFNETSRAAAVAGHIEIQHIVHLKD